MRRSTAAAVGTLTGAALIVGVRLSVQPPAGQATAPPVDVANTTPAPTKSAGKATGAEKDAENQATRAPVRNGLTDGTFKGNGSTNPYGTVQVTIKVADGRITAAQATYPTTANSATINPPAIATLKQETLKEQSAKVDTVSGATYTSQSYRESLQAALDDARA